MDFDLDESDAVLMGVCAEFARWADVDPFLARVTAALIAIFLAPLAIPAYVAAGIVLSRRAQDRLLSCAEPKVPFTPAPRRRVRRLVPPPSRSPRPIGSCSRRASR